MTRRFSASSGAVIAAALVVTIGTGATAVTAALGDNDPLPQAAAGQRLGAGAPAGTPGPLQASAAARARSLALVKPKHLVSATLLVTSRSPLSGRTIRRLRHLSGVRHTQLVMAGHAHIDRNRAFVLGVDPVAFRPWTPKLTADSNPLWESIQRGDLTASFDMGDGAKLPLGESVPVAATREVMPMRIGAFASVGMAGVDAVVSAPRGRQLGLLPHTGLLISAPKADPLALRKSALHLVGKHGRVELLREVIITRDAGEFLTRVQIVNFLNAAKSRIGLPYVWGAAGPGSFDCSGLVQWAFARAGIRMPRVSEEQWLTGPHIPYADARPGDLLFWHYDPTDPTNIDHVAIYWGNGMMVVAPHTGLDVEYVPVPLSNFAGVVRVDPALAAELA
jgi:hypothetical protein